MKKILLLAGVLTLFTTAGCVVSEERRHGRERRPERHEEHTEIRVVAPVVIVPEVHVRHD
jgi:hypothetical protein